MNEYNIFVDLLNKYSQLTPWIQGLIGLGFCTIILGLAYFIKESIAALIRPFSRLQKAADDAMSESERERNMCTLSLFFHHPIE